MSVFDYLVTFRFNEPASADDALVILVWFIVQLAIRPDRGVLDTKPGTAKELEDRHQRGEIAEPLLPGLRLFEFDHIDFPCVHDCKGIANRPNMQ